MRIPVSSSPPFRLSELSPTLIVTSLARAQSLVGPEDQAGRPAERHTAVVARLAVDDPGHRPGAGVEQDLDGDDRAEVDPETALDAERHVAEAAQLAGVRVADVAAERSAEPDEPLHHRVGPEEQEGRGAPEVERAVAVRGGLRAHAVGPADDGGELGAEAVPPAGAHLQPAEVGAPEHEPVGPAQGELRRVRRQRRVGVGVGGRRLLGGGRGGLLDADDLRGERGRRLVGEAPRRLEHGVDVGEVPVRRTVGLVQPDLDPTDLAPSEPVAPGHRHPAGPGAGRARRLQRDAVAGRVDHGGRGRSERVRLVALRGRGLVRGSADGAARRRWEWSAGVTRAVRHRREAGVGRGTHRHHHGAGEREGGENLLHGTLHRCTRENCLAVLPFRQFGTFARPAPRRESCFRKQNRAL